MKKSVIADKLDSAQRLIDSTLHVCLSSNKSKALVSQLSAAKVEVSSTINFLTESKKRRSLSQTRRSMTVIDNTLAGLIEGLHSRDLSVKDFRAVCSNLQQKFIPNFKESAANDLARIERSRLIRAGLPVAESAAPELPTEPLTELQEQIKAAIASESSGWKEELANVKVGLKTLPIPGAATAATSDEEEDEEEGEDDEESIVQREERQQHMRLEAETDDVARRLLRLKAMRNEMPARLKAPYALARMPLVPLFESFLVTQPSNLEKLAIPNTDIQGYVILEQQMILLVSKDAITNSMEKKQSDFKNSADEEVGAKKVANKEILKRIQTLQNKLVAANKEAKSSVAPKIKLLTIELEKLQRDLDKKMRAGATPEERKLTNAIRNAERTDPISKIIGFMLAARTEYGRAETELKKKAVEDRKGGVKPEVQKMFDDAEAKLAKMNRQLSTMRKSRMDKADNKAAEEVAALQKRLRVLNAKETERVKPIRDLEAQISRLNAQHEADDEKLILRKRVVKRGVTYTPEDYARSVLSIINERGATKYSLVSATPAANPRNADILCFWIMPTTKLSALMKLAGGSAKVKEWDFPWEDGRHRHAERSNTKQWVHPSNDPKHPEYLEYEQNSPKRPEGWKSRAAKPPKRPMQ